MGEYAEMMLDGTCCTVCGEFMGEGSGYPETCAGCGGNDWEKDDDVVADMFPRTHKRLKAMQSEKVPCPQCGKKVKPLGVDDHIRDVHGT